jgi:hypothetical protein
MTQAIRRALLLLAAGAAAGCSATSVPIYGSDGKPYVFVDCSNMFNSLDDCYRLANQVCPTGYRLANSVAPRSNPFGNLVVDCQTPAGRTAMEPASLPTPAAP